VGVVTHRRGEPSTDMENSVQKIVPSSKDTSKLTDHKIADGHIELQLRGPLGFELGFDLVEGVVQDRHWVELGCLAFQHDGPTFAA
jgi:hypothetical protein